MSVSVFERMEIKYRLNRTQYEEVRRSMREHGMEVDRYGKNTIMSLYYDTPDYRLIRESLRVPQPYYKEKFRLRSYGIPSNEDTVFLELKKKVDGIVYKRREGMTLADAEHFLDGTWKPLYEDQILKEIGYFMQMYRPEPKMLIAYEREAYAGGEDGKLRLTFDENIRMREDELDLSMGSRGNNLSGEPFYIMELKADMAIPQWLCSTLSENRIFHSRFSKYGSFYTEKIRKEAEHV